jgi:hypothetical protein
VNGDGYSEVIVGAYQYDNGQTDEGRAYVYLGSSSGPMSPANWTAESDQASAGFGICVASAGDVNGDGYGDVIVSAQNYDQGEADEGQAYIYYGNEGPCRVIRPRQLCTNGITPIAPLGRSNLNDGFAIRAQFPALLGRGGVAMQYEVKPFGVPFSGTGLLLTDEVESDASGHAELDALVDGLSLDQLYHWRARASYGIARSPFQRHGPWFTMPTNGWNEADLRTACTSVGDMNCDCSINALDIAPFVQAILDPPGYAASHPECNLYYADMQPDGQVNVGDVQAFADLLIASP